VPAKVPTDVPGPLLLKSTLIRVAVADDAMTEATARAIGVTMARTRGRQIPPLQGVPDQSRDDTRRVIAFVVYIDSFFACGFG
jgi:hypothetical protein